MRIEVCGRDDGPGTCGFSGAYELFEAFKHEVKDRGLDGEVAVTRSGCQGACSCGPSVMVFPSAQHYTEVSVEQISTIIDRHLERTRTTAVS